MQSSPEGPGPGPADAGDDEPRAEYDFGGGVRGRYATRIAEPARVVTLDPDVAAVFPDADAVNAALRALVAIVDRRRTA